MMTTKTEQNQNVDLDYKLKIKDFFEDFADTWDDRFQGTKAAQYFKHKRLKLMARHLQDDYESLLEAGCGTGFHIMRLLKAGQKGLGFDVAEKMLARARVLKESQFKNLNLEFAKDDGENLSLSSNSYDRVIFVGYLIHLQQPQQAVNELFRVLKPGGRVVGLVSNRWNPWYSLNLRRLFAKDYGVLPRDQEFSPPEVRQLFQNAGFKNIRLEIFNSLPGKLPNWAYYPGRLLNTAFALWPISQLGWHIMAIAEKPRTDHREVG